MPKAESTHTTRPLGRRSLASGGAALFALAGGAAVASPSSPDAELIAAASEHARLVNAYCTVCLALDHLPGGPDQDAQDALLEAELDAIGKMMDVLYQTLSDIPAQGRDGLRAKAEVLSYWMGDGKEPLADSLMRDLLGRT